MTSDSCDHADKGEFPCPCPPDCLCKKRACILMPTPEDLRRATEKLLGLPCYCVCHNPVSSRAWCEHCQGRNEVGWAQLERRLETAKRILVDTSGFLYEYLHHGADDIRGRIQYFLDTGLDSDPQK